MSAGFSHGAKKAGDRDFGLPTFRMHEQRIGSGFSGVYNFKFLLNEHVDSLGIPLAV